MAVVVAEVKPAMFFCLHKLRYTLGQHAAQKAKVAHLIWVCVGLNFRTHDFPHAWAGVKLGGFMVVNDGTNNVI